jgi:transposase InsO family protein
MILIDAPTRWSHVYLLSTRNHAFARFIAQIIKLRAHYPDNPIKSIRMDSAAEFSSKAFNDYCMASGINVEHSILYVYTQIELAESLIKRVKLIACHADCIFDEDNFLALGETICTITNARK